MSRACTEQRGQVHADMILATLFEEGLEYRLRYAEEMVRLGEQPGADRLIQSAAFHALAYAVWDASEFDRVEGLNRAAGRSDLETGATVNTGLDLLQDATFAGHRDQAERAATLFGAGDTHFTMQKVPFQEALSQPVVDAAREVLGANRYDELYDRGTRMNVEEATDFLLNRRPARSTLDRDRT
jgi:hypothetical protein